MKSEDFPNSSTVKNTKIQVSHYKSIARGSSRTSEKGVHMY